jgi:hypothetical protein
VRVELEGGIRVLSVGDAFIVESECHFVESERTFVLPAVVVSRMRSFFLRVEELSVVTLPFDESTRVESLWMRVVERVVSCGTVGVVACARATAGAAKTAAAAMNFRNMLLPPSIRFIHRSTPRRSFVHEELARLKCKRWTAKEDFGPVCIGKIESDFAV